jgi:hypothetical protein
MSVGEGRELACKKSDRDAALPLAKLTGIWASYIDKVLIEIWRSRINR